MLIFIFQAIWFFIDELAGKGLDIAIVGKFLFYYSPNLIPNVLPLTILLASIMTFGNFAENYEFAAMKASGISLQRAMKSLIVFILLLSIGTFFFANNVIPAAEYKSYNLRRNIAKLKPALVISEGVFNDIGDLNLKVEDKYGENDKFLKNVIIHMKNTKNENSTVIKSKAGELVSSENSNIIQLILKDGNYYEEVEQKKRKQQTFPHAKAHFETYTMNIDLSELNDVDLEKENISNTYKMLNIQELKYTADSLEKDYSKIVTNFGNSIYIRAANLHEKKDSLFTKKDSITAFEQNVLDMLDKNRELQIIDLALNTIRGAKNTVEGKKYDLKRRAKIINLHKIMMNDKIALALSCIILFFVGAPLGAIIRKGGLGLPIVIAIGLFITYYFIGIFAKNLAEDGSMNPHMSSWISTFILLPLGIYLTRRATADKEIFDIGNVTEKITRLFKKKTKS
ncbi:LptF/LptG family permease [Abyssalbus ytuae]|uniref:LptF/LptG family permease n=2 Tax=Abyssalbus ytuae TaxID=2926907 RepID=A0A9E6ZNT4_9FLAO|nr:LptF/LptG family permease [Abyssalbus ytuae]